MHRDRRRLVGLEHHQNARKADGARSKCARRGPASERQDAGSHCLDPIVRAPTLKQRTAATTQTTSVARASHGRIEHSEEATHRLNVRSAIICSMRLLSWNMGHIQGNWCDISGGSDVDVALLQEAVPPPPGATYETIPSIGEPWVTAGGNRRFCAAI